ncbi:MAG TPA: M48 family metallopeptidase [Gemmatimonadales bacterium]|nr:M48 family metallopeptidase [Gemmatimonadales bacterium]
MTRDDLFSQQEANRRRSFWLVTGFVVLFAWVGFGGDLGFYLLTRDAGPGGYHHTVPIIGLLATLVAGGICWYSWRRGPDRVLWATGAREVIEPGDEAERRLVNVVEEMAIAAGLPRPRIWVVPDADPNAFATGIAAAGASIAVTRGLLQALSRDELQGVVAHEMAHIRNLDIRLLTLLAAMVGAIALLSDGMGRMLRGGVRAGGGGGRSGKGGKGGNPLALVLVALWLLTLVLAPVLSRLLALGVSRKREYLADATGAQLTRNPMALASALEKLGAAPEPTRAISRGAAHLCIVDPKPTRFAEQESWLANLLATHPPIRQRILRLKGMAYQAARTAGANRA